MPLSRYANTVIAGTLALLLVVAIINYFVDPAHIYGNSGTVTSADYVKRLTKSNYGLFYSKNHWNEREIKREVALQLNETIDCAVIGSSRVMQISLLREPSALHKTCNKLINLGVSGASLEDYLALSWNILKSNKHPRKIVFGIDPWSMNFRREANWIHYKADYGEISYILTRDGLTESNENYHNKYNVALNLINLNYLLRSLKALYSRQNSQLREASLFDVNKGAEEQVMLPDGSIANSEKENKRVIVSPVIEYNNYKIVSGKWYDRQAIQLFEKLIIYLRENNVDAVFLLIPYHPFIWSQKSSDSLQAMQVIEKTIRGLAKKWQITILGSYDPGVVGCSFAEFKDFMHPQYACLAKLEKVMD